MTATIRPAAPQDVGDVVRLVGDQRVADGVEVPLLAHLEALLLNYIGDTTKAVYVVDHDGVPVGFLVATVSTDRMSEDRFIQVVARWVAPGFRSPAVSTALLAEAEHWGVAVGASRLYAFSDDPSEFDHRNWHVATPMYSRELRPKRVSA